MHEIIVIDESNILYVNNASTVHAEVIDGVIRPVDFRCTFDFRGMTIIDDPITQKMLFGLPIVFKDKDEGGS